MAPLPTRAESESSTNTTGVATPEGPATAPCRLPAVLLAPACPDLAALLARYGLDLKDVPNGAPIPGSFWGDAEAGLIGNALYAREDTPVHSILHEACHYICMDSARRAALDTNAGGDYAEENAVCYLQVLLADQLAGVGRARQLADMDAWGYSFRLGRAATWFQEDAADARDWLLRHGLIDSAEAPTFALRP